MCFHKCMMTIFEGRRRNAENIYFSHGGISGAQHQPIFKYTFKKHNWEKVFIEGLIFFTKLHLFWGKAIYLYCVVILAFERLLPSYKV